VRQGTNPSPSIWVNAAETSADIHGARLLQELRRLAPEHRFLGMGGPEMRRTDFRALHRSEELSLFGLTEVLSHLPRIYRLFRRIKAELLRERPRGIVLIDAPDFHFPLAKMAAKRGIPVFYYITPQVWAWRKGRVRVLRKYVNRVLCIFPFEQEFFRACGLDAEFVGHPLLQQMDLESLDQVQPEDGALGIMPGSRSKEVSALLPRFAEAARIVRDTLPDATFRIFLAPSIAAERIESLWPRELPHRIVSFAERYAELRRCRLVWAASGTASLECALLGVPAIVAYRLSWPTYCIGRLVVNVPHISTPNLILQKRVLPELIQAEANGRNLAEHALRWLNGPGELAAVRAELHRVRELLGHRKASSRAAERIMRDLASLEREQSAAGG
jgi:lipid-A-disaccharide synthase